MRRIGGYLDRARYAAEARLQIRQIGLKPSNMKGIMMPIRMKIRRPSPLSF